MKKLSVLLAALCAACSSVETIDGVNSMPLADTCHVRVFQTRAQAEKQGTIEELCVINGTSAPSLVHTIQTAVDKHKSKACGCGATNAYIESRTQSGWDVATVTMVAFRFVKP